jgi:LmbE family N-acetylglucosaminyl deacetylase
MDVKGRRVLAVGAHPDDVEFMCAGTLALLGDLGCRIHVATLTGGDYGSDQHSPEEIRKIRVNEAGEACRRLGAEYHYAGFSDFGIYHNDRTNRRVTALVRSVDPWIVITHPPEDYMSDHEITSRLVRNACFYAMVRNYDLREFTDAKCPSGVPYLFYAQPVEGIGIFGQKVTPEFYVDISSRIDLKEEMLACHESQRKWLRQHHGIDEYLESMRRWGRELAQEATDRAGEAWVYAEAFQQHKSHAYPKDNIFESLLGDRVIPARV